jgi:negative regulator of sigma E activity
MFQYSSSTILVSSYPCVLQNIPRPSLIYNIVELSKIRLASNQCQALNVTISDDHMMIQLSTIFYMHLTVMEGAANRFSNRGDK